MPCARHQLNTYCWSHELPRLHTVGQMVGTPTALSATPSAPPPHCRPTGHCSNIPCQLTGHHSNPAVSQLVITPTPLSADWSLLQPNCQPTGHHSNPTVGQLVIASTPLLADWSLLQHTLSSDWSLLPHTLSADWSPLQHTLSAAPLAHQPHCQPTHY